MLVKFLTIIFVFFNPFVFLISSQTAKTDLNLAAIGPIVQTAQKLPLSESYVIAQSNPDFLPIRNWSVDEPAIEVQAALVLDPEKDKILYQKNIAQVLPIASLTKLMTALIVLENMDLEQIVIVSKEAVAAYGDMGGLVIDEKISIRNLLYALLMESSNDAAVALAETFKEQSLGGSEAKALLPPLVSLMNQKAQELGLENTHFVEPTGYEPANVSTALDLAQLTKYTLHYPHLLEKSGGGSGAGYSLNQPIIWQILKTPFIDCQSADGWINHHLVNTNQLLNSLPNIIGGKTGYTEEAQGCIILVTERSQTDHLIFIILGAKERFLEMEKLVNWVEKAYIW